MTKNTIHWKSNLYEEKHSFIYAYGEQLLEMLNPKPNEKILDLGCGNGVLTDKIKSLGAEVIGVDASPDMIKAAIEKFPQIHFSVMDATLLDLPITFDAIFSNAVMHWVPEAHKAAKNIFNSLNSGGRFVAEFGGKGNNNNLITALKNAFVHFGLNANANIDFWYFPSIAEYASVLESVGFKVHFCHLFERPTELQDTENGVKEWFKMFGEKFFEGLDSDTIDKVLNKTQESLEASNFKNGKWDADYMRLRIIAYKP